MTAATAVLEVEGLTTDFPGESGRVPVVDDVSLSIERGEVLALVGESGCGKSVTALSILRLVPRPGRIASGSIRLEGNDVRGLSIPEMRQVRGHQISMIFQEPMTSLNPVARVGDQVAEAIRLHEKINRQAARRRVLELFEQVGIPDPEARLDAYPHQLSGGLKQRAMIAMALATRPKLLIADEPTTALDVTIQAQILELLRDLQRDIGMSILLITHDLGIVNEMADRVAVMYAGRVIEEGSRVDVLGGARHPYTEGLLRSIPALGRPGQRLSEIPGVVPPPAQWPSGCRFSTRCQRVFEPCASRVPEATGFGDGHWVCCFAVSAEEGAA
jgi:oligopeptide/dipeptide ABC transporter ATP-binding protein